MAEFADVMHNAKRICDEYADKHKCNGCPIDNFDGCVFAGGVNCDEVYFAQMERIVCDWAKEHPEPVYPSWKKGWKQLFTDGYVACPNNLFDAHLPCNVVCSQCMERPMLPHIAQKLGVKPIEGKRSGHMV